MDLIAVDPELHVLLTEIRGSRQDSATVLALLCTQETLKEARHSWREDKPYQQENKVPKESLPWLYMATAWLWGALLGGQSSCQLESTQNLVAVNVAASQSHIWDVIRVYFL